MPSDDRQLGSQDVDLFELLQVLREEKFLILIASVVAAGAALVYLFLVQPVYEARTYLQPPSQNDIAVLNRGRGGQTGLGMLSSLDVYQFYSRSLRSESVRQRFFREVYLPSLDPKVRHSSQDDLYADFGKLLQVVRGNGDIGSHSYVQVRLSSPEQAVDWSQRYARLASEQAKKNVIRDVRADAVAKANNIEQEITAARGVARKQREDQVARLNEALKIARSVDLKNPPIISQSLSSQVSAGMSGDLIYMRGSKALESEIANLVSRPSDDPYIPNLRQLQEDMEFYRDLQVDPSTIEVYMQDGVVGVPDVPISPKKPLIIAFGTLLGLVAGVVVVVLRRFLFARKS